MVVVMEEEGSPDGDKATGRRVGSPVNQNPSRPICQSLTHSISSLFSVALFRGVGALSDFGVECR